MDNQQNEVILKETNLRKKEKTKILSIFSFTLSETKTERFQTALSS